MKLKPKSTVHNPRALLYKRFTDLEKSLAKRILYITQDGKQWIFDDESISFLPYSGSTSGFEETIYAYNTNDLNEIYVFSYKNASFYYEYNEESGKGAWQLTSGDFAEPQDAPIVSTRADSLGTLYYEYEVPSNCIVDFPEQFLVTLQFDIKANFQIKISNGIGQVAFYRVNRRRGEENPCIAQRVTIAENYPQKPNTVIITGGVSF